MGAHKSGYKWSEEAKERKSIATIGENNNFYGKHHTEEAKERMRIKNSIHMKGVQQWLGKKHTQETRQKMSETAKRNWEEESFVKAHLIGFNRKPNNAEIKLEQILDKLFPQQWKFVGDFSVWFGKANPDFIHNNGKKLIIELFGDYWHQGEDGKDRIANFAKYGYKTLIIWESELDDEGLIINKVNQLLASSSTEGQTKLGY